MAQLNILPMGDAALLLQLADLTQVLRMLRLVQPGEAGIEEIIPAARTLLLRFNPLQTTPAKLHAYLQPLYQRAQADLDEPPLGSPGLANLARAPRIEIPVRYCGADLEALAHELGFSARELIERHSGTDFLAAFAGFAPGFVYLSGGDPCFAKVARKDVPRTRVPAGSVAVAAGFSAVYPQESPGGWQLLGQTSLKMWDLQRSPPALIQPGFVVRFVDQAAVGRSTSLPPKPAPGAAKPRALSMPRAKPPISPGKTPAIGAQPPETAQPSMRVLEPGMQSLLQDFGRFGQAHLGLGPSGVLDRANSSAANLLVGNPAGAAILENLLGALALECLQDAVLAVCGASVAVSLSSGSGMRQPAAMGQPIFMRRGDVLRLGRARAGARSYVAIAGGWQAQTVLGSSATDTLARVGPEPLRRGQCLAVAHKGQNPAWQPASGRLWQSPTALGRACKELCLRIVLGPRDSWFEPDSIRLLCAQPWQVSNQSNRVGLRLIGAQALQRRISAQLPSEAMVAGAIQVPPAGQPLIFLADHPLTGGYPVIATVVQRDLDSLGQAVVGSLLRFVPA